MEGDPAVRTLVATPIDTVAAKIAALIDALRPAVIVTIDGSDGHRDHAHIRDATLAAVESAAWATPRVYLHCLPQSLFRTWVEVLKAQQPDSTYLALGDLGTPEDLITTVIDTSAYLELREAAMSLHASQTPPYNVMPSDVRRDFLTAERLRRIEPEWSGGPVETDIFDD
jgi:LmbE family N-acetylglucosaminyl deacetylase